MRSGSSSIPSETSHSRAIAASIKSNWEEDDKAFDALADASGGLSLKAAAAAAFDLLELTSVDELPALTGELDDDLLAIQLE